MLASRPELAILVSWSKISLFDAMLKSEVPDDPFFALLRAYPEETSVFVLGFITGSAAHSIADWLVTGGKRYLRMLGIPVRGNYRYHDRGVSSVRSVWG